MSLYYPKKVITECHFLRDMFYKDSYIKKIVLDIEFKICCKFIEENIIEVDLDNGFECVNNVISSSREFDYKLRGLRVDKFNSVLICIDNDYGIGVTNNYEMFDEKRIITIDEWIIKRIIE